jgi:surface protein
MKTLNQFINEVLFDLKDYRHIVKARTVKPKDKKELKQIIKDTIKKEGNKCDLNFIDTSGITDMSYLFYYDLTDFNGDISEWDTSNVINMEYMFSYTIFDGDISEWDVSNVVDMEGMFYISEFNGDISKWDVSNVENMQYMFAKSVFCGDLSKWKLKNDDNTLLNYMFNLSNLELTYGITPKIDKNCHLINIKTL